MEGKVFGKIFGGKVWGENLQQLFLEEKSESHGEETWEKMASKDEGRLGGKKFGRKLCEKNQSTGSSRLYL